MITKPIVLVLGAGASAPFGLPTGIRLSELVVDSLRPGNEGFNALQQFCAYSQEEVQGFREAFFHSGRNSVDAFLEHRTDLIKIGKAAMAECLIRYENDRRLFDFKDNWLREIYARMATSFDDFGKNKLSFVTFNYDRTIEHFFYSALKNTYNRTDDECASMLKDAIPIIHLHGRLGFLPWQGGETREFVHTLSKQTLEVCVNNMKVIHEDLRDGRDEDFRRAKQLMANADQIVFMGFGYNLTNIERLDIANLPQEKAIGTCQGLGARGEDSVRTSTNGRVRLVGGDCTHFVREVIAWA